MLESPPGEQRQLSIMPGIPPVYSMPPPSTPRSRQAQNRLYPASPFPQPFFIDPTCTDGSSAGLLASSSSPPEVSSQSSLSPNGFSTDFDASDYQQFQDFPADWDLEPWNHAGSHSGGPTDSSSPDDPSSLTKMEETRDVDDKEITPTKVAKTPKKNVKRASNSWMIFRSEVVSSLKSGGNDQISAAAKEMRRLQLEYFAEHPEKIDEEASPEDDDVVDPPEASTGRGKSRSKFGGSVTIEGKSYNLPSADFLVSILETIEKGTTNDKLPQMDMSKFFSFQWKVLMSEEEKQVFVKMAEKAKEDHKAAHPDYKYTPQRRVDKLREAEERKRQKAIARREKEEMKKQLKREKQAAKPRRRDRTRVRHSPMSPSTVTTQTTARPIHTMGRSLSYSGHGAHNTERSGGPLGLTADSFFMATEPGYMPTHPSSYDDSQRDRISAADLSAFAFPMSLGALPSLVTDQANAFTQNLSSTGGPYPSWQPSPIDPYPMLGYEQPSADYDLSGWQALPSQPYASPPRPVSLTNPGCLVPSTHISPDLSNSQNFAPLPVPEIGDGFDSAMSIQSLWNTQSQMPYDMFQISGPMSIPGGSSANVICTNNGSPHAASATIQAADDFVNDFDADFNAASQEAVLDQFSSWVDSQAGISGAEGALSGTENTAQNTLAPCTPTLEMSELVGEPARPSTAQSFDPFASIFIEETGDKILRGASLPPALGPRYDQDLSFLMMDASTFALDDNDTQDSQTTVPFDEGPFLPLQQSISPAGSWTTGLTPLEATFLRSSQNMSNRVASSSSSTSGTVRTVSSAHSAPRYVSASAFPKGSDASSRSTQASSFNGTGDRTTSQSIASLAAVFGADMMSQNDDIFSFDAGDVTGVDDKHGSTTRIVSATPSTGSVTVSLDGTGLQIPKASPRARSSVTPTTTRASKARTTAPPPPPAPGTGPVGGPVLRRGAPRGRTVAGKYTGGTE